MICEIETSIEIAMMLPEHMDMVEKIENDCFDHPWSRAELETARKKQHYKSKVAIVIPKHSNKKIVVASLFSERNKHRFIIHSIAVAKKWRRRGIGTALMNYFINNLCVSGPYEIYELVRETNLLAQKFYKAIGFVALKPQKDRFIGTDEDAYPMIFKWAWSPQGIEKDGCPVKCRIHDHLCVYCGDCY